MSTSLVSSAWWHWLLISVFVTFLLCLCGRECCARRRRCCCGQGKPAYVTCYLCGQEGVRRGDWVAHRARCGHIMRKRIAAMPTSVVAGCPTCRKPLKMMPM